MDAHKLEILIEQAGHPDAATRAEAAIGLADMVTGRSDDPAVGALIELTRDNEADVRDQAVFALGALAEADSPAVREALWARVDDPDQETREQAIRGLAIRRDPRSVPLLGQLLAADSAHLHTFQAAAVLADPTLLPALRAYDPTDPGVTEALTTCDPQLRAPRDRDSAALLKTVHRLLPNTDAALYAHRMEPTLTLTLTAPDGPLFWNVDRLLERAGGNPERAAALVAEDTGARSPAEGTSAV
ncbi:HEAT repeat domain-containing protein [Streptomyces sp. NPDC020898]|uniref:HEAT repeat domain-containing protein n=1 Tax=Streptomyces sp. NPDC020898 TaxID=3365101 RepID=UPI00379629F1